LEKDWKMKNPVFLIWNILNSAMVIAVTYDLPEPAAGSSSAILLQHRLRVVHSVQAALESLGHTVLPCLSDLNLEGHLKRAAPHIAFNLSACLRKEGDAACAPHVLEKMGIPFTGSPAAACAIAVDKARSKAILRQAGIPTPRYLVISDEKGIRIPDGSAFPLFVKPDRGGCSRGIHEENLIKEESVYVKTVQRILRRVNSPLLVEEFMPGREFSVGIIGNENPKILPIREFLFADGSEEAPFRSFKRKMIDFRKESAACPADLAPRERTRVEELALKAYRCLGCRDYARIDMRLDRDGAPHILDVNVLPSLARETSSIVMMAVKAGISYEDLISRILLLACRRYHIPCNDVTSFA